MFERLQVREGKTDQGQSLLIVGAAGGVGSILTQLASQLTALNVIGTASRPQTQSWVRELGADLVIDHSQPLSEELKRAGHAQVTHVASLTETADTLEQHKLLNRVAELIDAGTLKTTVGEHFGTINAANLRRAHELLESGTSRGKIVLEGF